jgi:hypothetical protein
MKAIYHLITVLIELLLRRSYHIVDAGTESLTLGTLQLCHAVNEECVEAKVSLSEREEKLTFESQVKLVA